MFWNWLRRKLRVPDREFAPAADYIVSVVTFRDFVLIFMRYGRIYRMTFDHNGVPFLMREMLEIPQWP